MWSKLTELQKINYKNYCDNKYGNTIIASENGEPLYMDEEGYMVNTNIIIELLFNINEN